MLKDESDTHNEWEKQHEQLDRQQRDGLALSKADFQTNIQRRKKGLWFLSKSSAKSSKAVFKLWMALFKQPVMFKHSLYNVLKTLSIFDVDDCHAHFDSSNRIIMSMDMSDTMKCKQNAFIDHHVMVFPVSKDKQQHPKPLGMRNQNTGGQVGEELDDMQRASRQKKTVLKKTFCLGVPWYL